MQAIAFRARRVVTRTGPDGQSLTEVQNVELDPAEGLRRTVRFFDGSGRELQVTRSRRKSTGRTTRRARKDVRRRRKTPHPRLVTR